MPPLCFCHAESATPPPRYTRSAGSRTTRSMNRSAPGQWYPGWRIGSAQFTRTMIWTAPWTGRFVQVLHCNVCVFVTDAKVIDLDDIGMINLRNHLVFLQESIESADAVGNFWQLLQNLENNLDAGRFAFGKINRGM